MTKKPKSSDAITQVVKTEESTNGDRLGILKSRLAIAKEWAKKPHKAWKEWIAEYEIEDVSDTDEIRDKVRIGYVFRRVESDLPAIFDDQPEIFIKGKGKNRTLDPLFDGLYDWLWDIQNLEESIEDVTTYFLLLGMGFVESPWVTKTKKVKGTEDRPVIDETGQPVIDEQGQPMTMPQEVTYEVPVIDWPKAKADNPFKYYFSPETKFAPIMDYEHCPYYFKEHTMTVDEIKSRFNKTVEASETLHIEDDSDTNEVMDKIKDDVQKDDIKRVTVYEYYGVLPKNMVEDIKDQEGNSVEWSYDKDYHVWITKNEELKAEECPYAIKPLFPLGNYGLANKFWKFGEAKHLMPLIQELQMYRTQILRHTRKIANPKLLVVEDMNVDEKQLRDPREGVVVKYQPGASQLKPEYLNPSALGREVGEGISEARQDLEKTSGTFDLQSGGGQSQVKTPRGIQVFSEAADKNVRRKRKKVARLIRQLIIFQFKQISMFWQPDGTHTIDVVADGEEQKLPVVEEVLRIIGSDDILSKLDIEVESMSVNKVQMKQDSLDLLDTALDSEAQYPGLLNIAEIWKDVLQNGFGKRDGDRYLNPPEVREQMLAQQAKAAQPEPKEQEPPAKLAPIPFDALPPEGKIQAAEMAGVELTPEGLALQDSVQHIQDANKIPDQKPLQKVEQNGTN